MRISWMLSFVICFGLVAQQPPGFKKRADSSGKAVKTAAPKLFEDFPVAEAPPMNVARVTTTAIAELLRLPEGEGGDEWPYEGVYREDGGKLPIGYRIGGTSIVCLGLVAAPGYQGDKARQAAVAKGLAFVCKTLEVDRMAIDFKGGYDVRGWAHIYALEMLLHLTDFHVVPQDQRAEVAKKTKFLVRALVESAIPSGGGWNYSRRAGYLSPKNRASTFMTPAALQATTSLASLPAKTAPSIEPRNF